MNFLKVATKKQILLRLLENLHGLAERKMDRESQLRYVEAMLAIEPNSVAHRGLRAVLRMNTGRKSSAIKDLDWIIEREPPNIDLDRIYEMRRAFEESRD